ncbi:12599_t:CDS:2, partial [Acaulospora morrowiae]
DSILHESSSDISSNIHTYSSEPKSSENKEIDEFLDLKSKEGVSSEIKQRNREKKLQRESAEDQSLNLISDTSISPEQNHVSGKEKCQEISVTNLRDDRQEKCQEISVTDDRQNETMEPDEIEPTKSQYIEQGLIKELLSDISIISSVIIPEYRPFQITTQSLTSYTSNSRDEISEKVKSLPETAKLR